MPFHADAADFDNSGDHRDWIGIGKTLRATDGDRDWPDW